MGKKKYTMMVGYKYFASIHMILCHGKIDEIAAIKIDDKFINLIAGNSIVPKITSSGGYRVWEPTLHGGLDADISSGGTGADENGGTGGVTGDYDVMLGDQVAANGWLIHTVGDGRMPAFKGLVNIVLKGMYLTAISSNIHQWKFWVRHYPKALSSQYSVIDGFSANGAHIIYEVLTNSRWGMSISMTKINAVSFLACAKTLYDEGIGLSFILAQEGSGEQFIKVVLNHINGVLFISPTDGKYNLKLLRNDYAIANCFVIDESNCSQLSFARPSISTSVNELVVTYYPRETDKSETITIHSLGDIEASGEIISDTVTFSGADTAKVAYLLGERELQMRNTPIATATVDVNRKLYKIAGGDVVLLNNKKNNIIDLPMRVVATALNEQNEALTLELVEDIFGMAVYSYNKEPETPWVEPPTTPLPLKDFLMFELSYFEVFETLTTTEFSTFTDVEAILNIAFGEQTYNTTSVNVNKYNSVDTLIDSSKSYYTGYAKLTSNLDCKSLFANVEFGYIQSDLTNTIAYLNGEWFRITTSTTNRINIDRGAFESFPKNHKIGDKIFIVGIFSHRDIDTMAIGQKPRYKFLTFAGSQFLAESAAPWETTTIKGRFGQPLPPSNIYVDGKEYLASTFNNSIKRIAFSHRNRKVQIATDQFPSFFKNSNITPEDDVTYTLNVYGDGAKKYTATTSGREFIIPELQITDVILTSNVAITTDGADSSYAKTNLIYKTIKLEIITSRGSTLSDSVFIQEMTNVGFGVTDFDTNFGG